MIRKLVKHGPSTLIVSLPAKWVKKMGLKAGDEVAVDEEDNQVTVSTSKNLRKDCITVNITNLDRTSVVLLMHALYRNGYCNVDLFFDKPETTHFRTGESVSFSKIIHDMTSRLIGYEVAKESPKHIKVTQVSFIDKDEIDNMINRTFMLLQDMVSSFCTALKDNDIAEIEKVEDKHNTITRLISFLLRAMSRGDYAEKSAIAAMPHTLANIDKIIDILKYIARDQLRSGSPVNRKVFPLLDIFNSSFVNYAKVSRRYNEENIVQISKQRDEFKAKQKELEGQLRKSELVMATSLRQGLEILFDLVEWRMHLWSISLAE